MESVQNDKKNKRRMSKAKNEIQNNGKRKKKRNDNDSNRAIK